MEYKNVYFLGIGGIGMSALARYFLHGGYAVAGYDRTPSHLTGELEAEGAAVHYEDDVRLIPEGFLDPKKTMVVYTPAVPQDHGEYRYFREHGFCVEKRSQMLGHLAEGKYVMAVAGTHGKTTTSTMVAWLNRALTGGGSAFLGGISKNFGGNLGAQRRGVLGSHHQRMHMFRTQCVGGDNSRQSRVNTAGQAKKNVRKTVFATIVFQSGCQLLPEFPHLNHSFVLVVDISFDRGMVARIDKVFPTPVADGNHVLHHGTGNIRKTVCFQNR